MFAARTEARQRPRMSTAQIPAPTRGVNLRDGIASLKVDEAMILDNWFPHEGYCQVRGGYTSHATGFGGPVHSIMEWAGPASRAMLAATATAIYNATAGGAAGAAVVTGLTNGRWQTTMFATAGGSFLVLANGADAVREYDGAAWTTPAITGVSSAALIAVASHKSRLWFVEAASTRAWYLPAASIAGAATLFELGERFTMGGRLVAIGSVSTDASEHGTDDLLCFVSSKGEIVVYQGTDPAAAATWALAGVYLTAPPIGNRSVAKIGGDLGILTETGVVSMRQIISTGRAGAEKAGITARIDQGIATSFAAYGANAGWQMAVHARSNQALINVPKSPTISIQYALNTHTGAWCSYSGLNATCWGTMNEEMYFASNGAVWHAENGHSDNGAAIVGEIKTSFQSYGNRGGTTRITQVRPLFTAGGRVIPAIQINVNYRNSQPLPADEYPVAAGSFGSSWGSGLWGSAVWGDAEQPYADWIAAQGIGTTASIHLVTRTAISAKLNAFDVMYEMAGALRL